MLMRCLANVPKLVSSIDPENHLANSTYDEIYRWGKGIVDGTTLPPVDETLQTIPAEQFVADYLYVKASQLSSPHAGWIIHSKIKSSRYSLMIHHLDYNGADRSADLAKLAVGCTITVTPFADTTVWTVDVIERHDDWVYVEASPPGFITYAGYYKDTFTFDIPATDKIVSLPSGEDVELEQYDLINATFGTLLADEGVLYMYGIGTIPNDEHPEVPEMSAENSLWQFDSGMLIYPYAPSKDKAPYIERRGINLTNDESMQIVTAVYPKMEGVGDVMVHVGAVDHIGGPVTAIRWDKAVKFNPEKDYRVTVRVAGRRHAIKFSAVAAPSAEGLIQNRFQNFRLAGYDIEFSQVGRR